MHSKELAKLLNGRQYGSEITKEEAKQAKENNLVVVFGYSDDGVELKGAIDEEFGIDRIYLNKNGLIENKCDDEDCPYYQELIESANYIHSEYCGFPEMPNGWMFKFNNPVPHETFDIVEDDEVSCKGIVFSLNDIN